MRRRLEDALISVLGTIIVFAIIVAYCLCLPFLNLFDGEKK